MSEDEEPLPRLRWACGDPDDRGYIYGDRLYVEAADEVEAAEKLLQMGRTDIVVGWNHVEGFLDGEWWDYDHYLITREKRKI